MKSVRNFDPRLSQRIMHRVSLYFEEVSSGDYEVRKDTQGKTRDTLYNPQQVGNIIRSYDTAAVESGDKILVFGSKEFLDQIYNNGCKLACKFCNALALDGHEKINWSIRGVFSDDNVQDFLDEKFYEEGYIETSPDYGFKLTGDSIEGNVFVGVECKQEYTSDNKEKVVFHPSSEKIQFNFCPICGKQISKDVKEFKDYYEGYISISEGLNRK